MGFTLEPKKLKTMSAVLQELGLSYKETMEIMKGVSKDMRLSKDLWWDNRKSKLIKLACALITFPEPTPISESIGAAALAVGLIQRRIKKSALHVDDVYRTYQELNRNILKIRQDIV
jgi:hypothetical protein